MTAVRLAARAAAIVMLLSGILCFLGDAVLSTGVLGPMRTTEFPVGSTSEAVRLPDGRYAVPMRHFGRVQIYDPSLHFQQGWPLGHDGALWTLVARPDGRLELYTAGHNEHYDEVYTPDGTRVSSVHYTGPYPPAGARAAGALSLPAAWWKFPLRGPIQAWITALAGALLGAASQSRQERQAQMQKWAERFGASRGSAPVELTESGYRRL